MRLRTRSTRTDTPFPYTPLFRPLHEVAQRVGHLLDRARGGGRAGTVAGDDEHRVIGAGESRPGVGLAIDESVAGRSEEHTSELQSLMRISYAVFCLKKKKRDSTTNTHIEQISKNKNNKHIK